MPTAPFGDADIQAVLDGVGGVTVTVGGTSARGQLRSTDEPLSSPDMGGAMGARQITVLVRTATFTGLLAQGVAATVDGVSHKITTFVQQGTGLLTLIYLAKP